MERRELAGLLGAHLVGTAAAAGAKPHLVNEEWPDRFMAEFARAAASGGDVFLCDPSWGAVEKAQRDALVTSSVGAGRPGRDRGWLMIPTGGSSGGLKFARHDQDTIAAAVAGFTRHFHVARVNALGLLPLHHVSGFMAWMRCLLTGGRYEPVEWKRLQAGDLPVRAGVAEGWMISLVPTQLQRLLELPGAVEWLRGFRIIFLGGGPAWPELLERAAAAQLPLSLSYGMTETAAMMTALRPEEFRAGIRNAGSPLPHASVQLDASGSVVVVAESLFRGYYPGWREEGAFTTTDTGSIDAMGRLTLGSRSDQAIITGGEKVQPAEVEQALRSSGQFREVAVIGLPSNEWGEEVVAVYPASERPDLEIVRQRLAESLAAAKRPKRFIAVPTWPVTEAGKLRRAVLRELALRSH